MKKIKPDDLICMNDQSATCAFRVDLAYARDDNFLFGECIYRKDAKLWLHRDLAKIVCRAAQTCARAHNVHFVLYDGLRTSDAQIRMMETRRVKDNPHWLEEPRLLSPPGTGGHPRGMAIDIGLETSDGAPLDMGTPFDYLAEDSSAEHNPAHRNYRYHHDAVYKNRQILDDAMKTASHELDMPLLFLPEEWWDFRFPREHYEKYQALKERDLPKSMCLLS